ncbi:5-formyltetrahydrofolate cyclo-ligase [Sphingorhabdus sp. Alg239-R122]|uniref:5-formyltetrahydrofolate cyclo-ligase n=1 Tax=Sphingorhabdus sp. Alg239-R122 TaxID=2305989 RepID=UPI0013DC60A6|nr:5-formyltetrahydrofolate cyclo-ligase [Sphingorhabdus sp. Alg239-R122]
MTETPDLKRALRREMRKKRQDFVNALPDSVRALVFRVPPPPVHYLMQQARCIGIYIARSYEAPTHHYTEFMHENGLPMAAPYFADNDSKMEFRSHGYENSLESGPFHIMQPKPSARIIVPELLIVPLVAYNGRMQRLGQGGGHYDRYLAENPGTKTIGLAWTAQEHDNIPVEAHDQPLDMIITQASIIEAEHASRGEKR